MRSLAIAFSTLTIARTPGSGTLTPASLGASTGYYPLVGAAVGAGVSYILSWDVWAPLAAALGLIFWVVITGALHLDGLADCCDAALAPNRGHEPDAMRQKRLSILKDPHIGTFGVVGICLTLLLKWNALLTGPWYAPVLAAVLARAILPWAIQRFPAASPGLASMFERRASPIMAAVLAGLAVLVLLLLTKEIAVLITAIIFGIAISLIVIYWLVKRFGGITGDVLGASVELTEIAVLVLCSIRAGHAL